MGWFRVYFHVGWCSLDVRAEDRVEANRKVWEALDKFSHGAVEGLHLGGYMVSTQHIRALGEADQHSGEPPVACAPSLEGSRDSGIRCHESQESG